MSQKPAIDDDLRSIRLTPIDVAVLRTIGERDALVARVKGPKTQSPADVENYETMKRHGAKFSTRLFANRGETLSATVAARYRRALAKLVRSGLATQYSETGVQITHAQLTDSGKSRLEQLQNEQTTK